MFLFYIISIERAFFAMKLNKTRLRNKMEDEFFKKLLGTLYWERDCNEDYDRFDNWCFQYCEESWGEI